MSFSKNIRRSASTRTRKRARADSSARSNELGNTVWIRPPGARCSAASRRNRRRTASPVSPPCHARAVQSSPMRSVTYGGLSAITSNGPRRPRKRSHRITARGRRFAIAFWRARRTASGFASVATARALLAAWSATSPVPVPISRNRSPSRTSVVRRRRNVSSLGGYTARSLAIVIIGSRLPTPKGPATLIVRATSHARGVPLHRRRAFDPVRHPLCGLAQGPPVADLRGRDRLSLHPGVRGRRVRFDGQVVGRLLLRSRPLAMRPARRRVSVRDRPLRSVDVYHVPVPPLGVLPSPVQHGLPRAVRPHA